MEVVAHTRLGFMKGSAGKRIVKEGDDSSTLILMTHTVSWNVRPSVTTINAAWWRGWWLHT